MMTIKFILSPTITFIKVKFKNITNKKKNNYVPNPGRE